jgi:hypothetical protein
MIIFASKPMFMAKLCIGIMWRFGMMFFDEASPARDVVKN